VYKSPLFNAQFTYRLRRGERESAVVITVAMAEPGGAPASPRTPPMAKRTPPLTSPKVHPVSPTQKQKKPKSLWKVWKSLSSAEKMGYCMVAVPMLPLVIAFGPIIALHLALERSNAEFYQGANIPLRTSSQTSALGKITKIKAMATRLYFFWWILTTCRCFARGGSAGTHTHTHAPAVPRRRFLATRQAVLLTLAELEEKNPSQPTLADDLLTTFYRLPLSPLSPHLHVTNRKLFSCTLHTQTLTRTPRGRRRRTGTRWATHPRGPSARRPCAAAAAGASVSLHRGGRAAPTRRKRRTNCGSKTCAWKQSARWGL
jgi:hypothetical protein